MGHPEESRSKIVRLVHEYDLDGVGDDLEERWTRSQDRQGLRQLAEYFNVELLRAALAPDDVEPLEGEVENMYRLLTDGDVSSGVQTQAENRLERRGIDVDQLKRDFVSKQAIHTYLSSYRDAEPPEDNLDPTEARSRKGEAIERLRQRLASVTERALTDLRNTKNLTLGDFNVLITVRVHCTDCGTQATVHDLLDRGGCDCDAS